MAHSNERKKKKTDDKKKIPQEETAARKMSFLDHCARVSILDMIRYVNKASYDRMKSKTIQYRPI